MILSTVGSGRFVDLYDRGSDYTGVQHVFFAVLLLSITVVVLGLAFKVAMKVARRKA